MVYYHGTTIGRIENIFAARKIKITTKENTQYSTEGDTATTCGYVFLTSYFNQAMQFAMLADLKNERRNEIVIFEVVIEESELMDDMDEMRHQTYKTVCECPSNACKVIPRDLSFGEDVKRYVILPFKSFNHASCCIDDSNYLQKIESLWKLIDIRSNEH